MRRIIVNWMERHRSRTSQILHAIGIPMLVASVVLAVVQLVQWRWDLWWRPAALFVGSYFLQWLGHVAEGNDMGEVVLIKKMLGKPYVAISPRYSKEADA